MGVSRFIRFGSMRRFLVSTSATSAPAASRWKLFSALTGVTSLAIFLQAVTAGEFVSQDHRGGWIEVHNIISDVTLVVALGTAIFALVALRKFAPTLAWLSVVLFVLILIQSILGHLITDSHADGWIGVHVPLAFVIFGLTAWISFRATATRRAATASAG